MMHSDLPLAFRNLALSEPERGAVLRFLAEAPTAAPEVQVLAPRRTSTGHLVIVLAFPEGETWALTQALVGLCLRIQADTGVPLHLD